jgi:hypothetical protein
MYHTGGLPAAVSMVVQVEADNLEERFGRGSRGLEHGARRFIFQEAYLCDYFPTCRNSGAISYISENRGANCAEFYG